MQKKLQKSRTNVVLTGTLAGIAEYFGIDPTIVRVIYVFLSLVLIGSPVILYILLALVIPSAPRGRDSYGHNNPYYGKKNRPANERKRTKSMKMTGATFNDLPTALNS
jgi:phage shock protein PspC (stress-responsive transcriptional regulator)